MADIQPPDLETKMAILDKKAELVGITLPPEVCAFIAKKTKSNVRELEGALIKLTAYSSLTGAPSRSAMAQQVLKDMLQKQDRRITIDSIQKAVAERYSIKPAQLKEKSNRKEIVVPRQVAMFLVKELTHGLPAGDRPRVWRKAPHDGHPFHQENRRVSAAAIPTSTK